MNVAPVNLILWRLSDARNALLRSPLVSSWNLYGELNKQQYEAEKPTFDMAITTRLSTV